MSNNLTEKIQNALLLHKQGNFIEALTKYEEVLPLLASTTTKCSLLNNAGALSLSLSQPEKAYKFFLESNKITTELNQDTSPTLLSQNEFNLALVLSEHLNDPTRALSHGLKAIKYSPNVAKYHQLVGNILQMLNREELARKYFLTANQLSSEQLSEVQNNNSSQNDNGEEKSESSIKVWRKNLIKKFENNENIIVISEEPLLIYLENLLTDQECNEIIEEATPQLKSSYVTGYVKKIEEEELNEKKSENDLYRSSQTAWLTPSNSFQIPSQLLEKLSSILSIKPNYLKLHSENLQVVKYSEGQQFKIHHDSSPFQKRLFTALVYLSDENKQGTNSKKFYGGETWFPYAKFKNMNIKKEISDQLIINNPLEPVLDYEKAILNSLNHYEEKVLELKDTQANTQENTCSNFNTISSLLAGVSVKPKKGSLIVFVNHNNENELDPLAVHAGLPVVNNNENQEVEKWIANYWVGINSENLSNSINY